MLRLSALAVLLSLCVQSADAVELYRLVGDAPATGDYSLRRLSSGETLLIAPDGARVDPAIAESIPIPAGHVAYVVDEHRGANVHEFSAGQVRVLRDLGDFAIVSEPEGGHELDALKLCRERLVYQRPAASNSRPQVAKRAADPALKQTLVDEIGTKQAAFETRIGELSGAYWTIINGAFTFVNNRYTHGNDHLKGADYVEERFEDFGYVVQRQEFSVSGSPTQNLLAVKLGTTSADEIVVVGGHYDSISEAVSPGNPDLGAAPGAEDNASGTVGVLMLAELFAELETERTIHFIAFGGEEQGLHGSQHYVSEAVSNGDDVVAALTMDMISNWSSNYSVIIEGETEWESLMSIFENAVQTYTNIGYRKDYFSFGSDHVPFQQANIPAFLAIDWDYPSYEAYHQSDDTLDKVEGELGIEIVKAMAVALADVAGASDSSTPAPTLRSTRLLQNEPNPFNPNTLIQFELATAGNVRLEIFDLAGRRVQTLVDEARPAGPQSVRWDGRDAAGQTMASGSYFYRLTADGRQLSKRMTLLK